MLERLQKIIARAGIASRRRAEQLIVSGQVRVNGHLVTALGSKADPERDRIEAAGKLVRFAASKTYLLLHKPPHVVSTMADPEGRKSLRNFLTGITGRVFPVGRLDYSTSGVMILTNDGDLANRMLKAAGRLPQTYWIKVKGRLSEDELRRVVRESRARVRPLKLPHASRGHAANFWYEATLSEARRDALRASLMALEHPVEKMKRMSIAGLDVGNLPEGKYRHLQPKEIAALEHALAHSARPGSSAPRPGVNASRKRSQAAGGTRR